MRTCLPRRCRMRAATSRLIARESDAFEWPEFDERTASSLCYTSGTTGEPKGVLYSHRSTILHCYAMALPDASGLSGNDVLMPVVPMFHVNAWGTPYAAAMVGCSMVLPGPMLDGASLVQLIDQYKVTTALGVPTITTGKPTTLIKVTKKFSIFSAPPEFLTLRCWISSMTSTPIA